MCCRICNQNSNCTKTDHTKLFAFQLLSGKCFLGFFCIFGNVPVFFVLLYPVDTADDISRSKKHTGNYQFLYAIRIGSRCVKYNDSLFCTFLKRNIVHTRTGSCNSFQIRCKFHLVHCRTSYQDRICCFWCAYRCIVFCEFIQSYL